MLIFLVGYMGCGKSTIGRALARRLGKPLLDMDALIEEHCGKRVGEIFETFGEDGFRRMERDTLAEVISSYDDAVVATGGGTPCFFDNMEAMNRAGRTIYFQMSAEKLAVRLEHGLRQAARCCATRARTSWSNISARISASGNRSIRRPGS